MASALWGNILFTDTRLFANDFNLGLSIRDNTKRLRYKLVYQLFMIQIVLLCNLQKKITLHSPKLGIQNIKNKFARHFYTAIP